MTKQEALEQIKSLASGGTDFGYADEKETDGLNYEIEEDVGGEGQGDHAHYVLNVKHSEGNFYVMVTGYYSSYEGTDWSSGEVYECEPYMKQVRDWKKIK